MITVQSAILICLAIIPLSCASRPVRLSDGPGSEPTVMAPTSTATPVIATDAAATAQTICEAFAAPDVLKRAAIVRAVDAGLGRWLAGVDIVAAKDKGRFRGWTIRRLHPGDPCYRQVDLRPGDVILRINGKTIERPEQANEVWGALRKAPALQIDYVRAGRPTSLTFRIAE